MCLPLPILACLCLTGCTLQEPNGAREGTDAAQAVEALEDARSAAIELADALQDLERKIREAEDPVSRDALRRELERIRSQRSALEAAVVRAETALDQSDDAAASR